MIFDFTKPSAEAESSYTPGSKTEVADLLSLLEDYARILDAAKRLRTAQARRDHETALHSLRDQALTMPPPANGEILSNAPLSPRLRQALESVGPDSSAE